MSTQKPRHTEDGALYRTSDPIIEVRDAEVVFGMDRGVSRVLDGVDLDVGGPVGQRDAGVGRDPLADLAQPRRRPQRAVPVDAGLDVDVLDCRLDDGVAGRRQRVGAQRDRLAGLAGRRQPEPVGRPRAVPAGRLETAASGGRETDVE